MMICDTHVDYLSQMLADNAVTIHQLRHPNCGGFHSFPHGDHFHVGHPSVSVGLACKRDPDHVATAQRIHHQGIYLA